MDIVQVLEVGMLITFGASWPFNIIKSWRAKTAKGKSLYFEFIILVGYGMGVAAKFIQYSRTGSLPYAVWFYFLDIALVTIDLILTIRNHALDIRRDREIMERS